MKVDSFEKTGNQGLRRLTATAGFILFCLAAVVLVNKYVLNSYKFNGDFVTYYEAGRDFLAGNSIFLYPNVQTPFLIVVLSPLALLSFKTASYLWAAVAIVCYLGVLWIVLSELKIRIATEYRLLFLGTCLLWYPFLENIFVGPVSMLFILLIVLAWAMMRSKRDLLAGIFIGCVVLIKLYPGIFLLYLLLRKRWLAVAGVFAALLVGFTISFIAVGAEDYYYYIFKQLPAGAPVYMAKRDNLSYSGFLNNLFSGVSFQPLVHLGGKTIFLILFLDIITALTLVYQIYRLPSTKEADDVGFASTIIAMLLVSPLTWQHMLPMLFIPFGIAYQQSPRWKVDPRFLRLLLLSVYLVSLPVASISQKIFLVNQSSLPPWYIAFLLVGPTIGLLLLWKLLSSTHNSFTRLQSSL